MKKFLSVAMCLALGLTVAGCEMQGATEETKTSETPTVEVNVDGGGEAVEVVLPEEATEAINEATGEEDSAEMPAEETPTEEGMAQ